MTTHPLFSQATFLKGATNLKQCPPDVGTEVAFLGRSNAGKSSALNVLTGQRSLARTSKTPGRTLMLNFFTLDDSNSLVDLPGYGFARITDAQRKQIQSMLAEYLFHRKSLSGLIWLMDIRHPLTERDVEVLEVAFETGIPIHLLLTKADKISRGAAGQALQKVRNCLPEDYPITAQTFSALKRTGLQELQKKIESWLSESG